MPSEHQSSVFKAFMRQVHIVLNDDSIPIAEILLRRTDGILLSFTPGNDYRPKEDIAKEKEDDEK